MEVWMGEKPSLKHIHVFGCEAYSHVPQEKWLKLDNKVVKCIFIEYGTGVKGYNLYDPISINVLYRRSVIFKEVKPSPKIV